MSNEPLQDRDDDDDDDDDGDKQESTFTFLTQGSWTVQDLELLAVSVSQIYDARLATFLWTKRFLDDVETRRLRLEKAFRSMEKRMPGPFFHEWYEVWLELMKKGEYPALPFNAPFPLSMQSGFPTAIQVYESLDLYSEGKDRCIILRARMSSPGGFSFTGLGEIVKELREFIKDVWYRNSQEKRKGEIEIEKSKLDLVEKYLTLKESQSSSHELTVTVVAGIAGLIELERNGKLRQVDENIDHSGDL
ncbi:MAG: hypothetical protein ACRDHZ_04900 [Ktedonobacteraceae bacterium]